MLNRTCELAKSLVSSDIDADALAILNDACTGCRNVCRN